MKIAVITPVNHLPKQVNELLHIKGECSFILDGDAKQVRNFLLRTEAEAIFCNPNKQKFIIGKNILKGTKVKLINTCSTGTNHINLKYCERHNIEILSLTEDYKLINNLPSTAELAFALMMNLLRKIPNSIDDVNAGNWNYVPFVGRQVAGLTIGIIGYGRLGKIMERYCKAFGANVLLYDPYDCTMARSSYSSLNNLLERSDVISLHVHVTDETKYMINKEKIGYCKKKPYIINTSRGEIVNETDIVQALTSKKINGYAADVLEHEFDDITKSPIINGIDNGLNILVTPHIGGMTIEGQTKAYTWAINKF